MTWVAVGITVVSTAYAAYSTSEQNKGMAEQAEADAEAQKAQGRVEAERIRREKSKVQSQAHATIAENGLDVNEGTSVVINDQIEVDGSYDANMAEIAGYNASQRLKSEAGIYRKNANTALASGALNSFSAGLSAYGSSGGWK
jgi:hypothetical protein